MRLPAEGTRVVVRYRLPAGSAPPMTDVIGHLERSGPVLRVRTKHGDVVSVAADDVVTIKALTATPVRTGDIRNLEHAAACGWPGTEQAWLDGWLLRFADGVTHRGNSAVPLGMETNVSALPAIIEWYAARAVTPWLSLPDRVIRVEAAAWQLETMVMVRDLSPADADQPDESVRLTAFPDTAWLRVYEREVRPEVLTAVVNGDVAFGSIPEAAVGRAAVTEAPDGTRWVGLSAVRVDGAQRRRGHARRVCAALIGWGARKDATRAYIQVLADNSAGIALWESMGFTVHHRSRYADARSL
jgi:GNAT superfamily N-acetyltransferase